MNVYEKASEVGIVLSHEMSLNSPFGDSEVDDAAQGERYVA